MLVGREPERRALLRRLAAARAGSSSALVVIGEAGIGKTALLAEAEGMATGMRVLRAVGTTAERDLPFGGLSQLLQPVLELLDRIPAAQAEVLARALALRPGPPPERFAAGVATLSLVSRAADDTPLLVVVDDLHQLDRASVDAVLFVARRLLTDPVALVLGVRSDAGADDLVADLDRLPLAGLGSEDAQTLVADRALTAEQVSRLQRLTAGNPLALVEMAAYPELLSHDSDAVPVPRLIAQAFLARLAPMGDDTRTALLLAALGDVDLATLSRACAAAGAAVADLGDAERVGLVTLGGDRVHFRHPLLRAAVQQAAEPAARRAAHARLAAALDPGELDRRARHLAAATLEPDGPVAEELERAAGSARDRGAFAVAAERYERSAQLTPDLAPRVARLTAAGEAAWLGGLAEHAATLLEAAARAAPDAASRARALAQQGVVTARSGALDEARDLLVAAASSEEDPDAATFLLAEAVYTCFYLGDGRTTAALVRDLEALRPRHRSAAARLLGDLASGIGLIVQGAGVAGAARVRRAVGSAVGSDLAADPRWLPWLLLGPIWLRESGDPRHLVEAVADARGRAALGTLPFLLFHASRDDATTDRWAAAEAGFREAIDLADETGMRTDAAMSLSGLTWLLARQGREAETHEVATRAERACERSSLNLGLAWVRYGLGDLAAGLGDPAAAVTRYREQQALVARFGVTDPDLSPAAELVECWVRLGEPDRALAEARAFAEAAAAKGQPWSRARAHRALALAGVDPEAEFAAALADHASTPDTYESARTRLALGAWLRRERRRSEARPHLRAALDDFERLAATPWAAAAAAELTATGERVHRRSGEAAQPLTPQEFRIARLLGEGRTTREAAAALFLSPKTVEYHLRHVYIKLGLASRRELTDRLTSDPELRGHAPG